jgi:hypothetical protein
MTRASAWVGWVWFASLILMASGAYNVFAGLVAVIGPDDAYVDSGINLWVFDVEGWGWTHLIFGILMVLVGACLALGQGWARVVAILLVTLNLLTQFAWLPATPWWSGIVIVLDALVLWAITVHGREAKEID